MESFTQFTLFSTYCSFGLAIPLIKCEKCDEIRKSLIKILDNNSHFAQKSVMEV